MEDLIKALMILNKYVTSYGKDYPCHCEHDILMICGVEYEDVPVLDLIWLDHYGFFEDADGEGFASYKFGSC